MLGRCFGLFWWGGAGLMSLMLGVSLKSKPPCHGGEEAHSSSQGTSSTTSIFGLSRPPGS